MIIHSLSTCLLSLVYYFLVQGYYAIYLNLLSRKGFKRAYLLDNGKVQNPTVKTVGGLALTAGKDYSITWSNASSRNAGAYIITLTGMGNYTGHAKASYKILKAANPMTVKPKPVKVSYKKLKKKKIVKKGADVFLVKKAKGNVSFLKKSGSKRIKINKKTGKLTIQKKTPKKLYKIKVKITAAGNNNYKKSSKTVLLKVKVK